MEESLKKRSDVMEALKKAEIALKAATAAKMLADSLNKNATMLQKVSLYYWLDFEFFISVCFGYP